MTDFEGPVACTNESVYMCVFYVIGVGYLHRFFLSVHMIKSVLPLVYQSQTLSVEFLTRLVLALNVLS